MYTFWEKKTVVSKSNPDKPRTRVVVKTLQEHFSAILAV